VLPNLFVDPSAHSSAQHEEFSVVSVLRKERMDAALLRDRSRDHDKKP
jgi:hypothetical protein